MIARIWHGTVPRPKADEYLKLLRTVAIPNYQSVPGNRAAFVLHQLEGNVAHFLTLTFWDSREAIAKFAGEDIEQAKYYDFDANFLIEKEPRVKHYELYKD